MLNLLLLPITIIIINADTPTETARDMTKEAVRYINARSPEKVRLRGVKRLHMTQIGNTMNGFANIGRYISAGNYVRKHVKKCRGKGTCLIMDGFINQQGTKYIGGRSPVCIPSTHYKVVWSAVGDGSFYNNKDTRIMGEIVVAHELLHALGSEHINDKKFSNGQTLYKTNIMNSLALGYGLSLHQIPFDPTSKFWIEGCWEHARNGGFSNAVSSSIPNEAHKKESRRRGRVCDLVPNLSVFH